MCGGRGVNVVIHIVCTLRYCRKAVWRKVPKNWNSIQHPCTRVEALQVHEGVVWSYWKCVRYYNGVVDGFADPEEVVPDWIVVGESVLIRPYNSSGVISFIGATEFAAGIWIGVELDTPTVEKCSR